MDVGARLRQARELRGVSIAELAATTRIQTRVLEALERNDLSVVPPLPYARGFVASVARELGLKADETVREYFEQFEVDPAVDPVSLPPSPLPIPWRAGAPALASLAVVLLIGALFWNRTEAPRLQEPGVIGTSGAAAVREEATLAARTQADVASQARNDTARPADVTPTSGAVVVVLETREPSWVAAIVDGERQMYQIVPAGTKTTLRGVQEITIRVGDAGAVHWSVNGREAEPMGARGQVRNVKVTPRSN